jgi:hypothetical protein
MPLSLPALNDLRSCVAVRRAFASDEREAAYVTEPLFMSCDRRVYRVDPAPSIPRLFY